MEGDDGGLPEDDGAFGSSRRALMLACPCRVEMCEGVEMYDSFVSMRGNLE